MCNGWPGRKVAVPERQSVLGERMITSLNIQWRDSVRTGSDISWDHLHGRLCMRAYVQPEDRQLPKISATTAEAEKAIFYRQIQVEIKTLKFILC